MVTSPSLSSRPGRGRACVPALGMSSSWSLSSPHPCCRPVVVDASLSLMRHHRGNRHPLVLVAPSSWLPLHCGRGCGLVPVVTPRHGVVASWPRHRCVLVMEVVASPSLTHRRCRPFVMVVSWSSVYYRPLVLDMSLWSHCGCCRCCCPLVTAASSLCCEVRQLSCWTCRWLMVAQRWGGVRVERTAELTDGWRGQGACIGIVLSSPLSLLSPCQMVQVWSHTRRRHVPLVLVVGAVAHILSSRPPHRIVVPSPRRPHRVTVVELWSS